MSKIKLNKKERVAVISALQEKRGAVEARLKYFQFLDRYDRDQFPVSLEDELEIETNELTRVIEKLGKRLSEQEMVL